MQSCQIDSGSIAYLVPAEALQSLPIYQNTYVPCSVSQNRRLIYIQHYSFEHTQARGRIHASNLDAAKHLLDLTSLIGTKVCTENRHAAWTVHRKNEKYPLFM